MQRFLIGIADEAFISDIFNIHNFGISFLLSIMRLGVIYFITYLWFTLNLSGRYRHKYFKND